MLTTLTTNTSTQARLPISSSRFQMKLLDAVIDIEARLTCFRMAPHAIIRDRGRVGGVDWLVTVNENPGVRRRLNLGLRASTASRR
jgi:hypothetical protein